MSTFTLIPMGVGQPETFRCRVYGGTDPDEEKKQFCRALASGGVIETDGNFERLAAMESRGWVVGELEKNPDGPGRVKRFRMTEFGCEEFERLTGEGLG